VQTLTVCQVSLAPGDPASTGPPATDADSATDVARCDLIRAALHLLLLRAHAHGKARRLADRSTTGPPPQHALAPPSILQPVLDTLQYEAFCGRVHAEVQRVADALGAAGVRARVRFAPAGETGSTLLRLVAENPAPRLSGEAVLRIDSRSGD
jgi:mediator of RNA polymerase II transcription subunit 17